MENSSTFNEAIDSLIAYCNYQERCSSEIIQKLRSFDLTESEQELIITELKERSVFDDNRYVNAFISGKFRIKKWGRVKIKAALRSKRIADSIIEIGFDEVLDMDKYLEQLELLLVKNGTS